MFKCTISVTCKVKFYRTLPSIFCQTQTSCDNTSPVRTWSFCTVLFFILFFQSKKIEATKYCVVSALETQERANSEKCRFQNEMDDKLFSTFKWLLTACYQNTNGTLFWSHIANLTFYLHSHDQLHKMWANISSCTTFVATTKLSFALGIKVDVMRTALTSYSGSSVRKKDLCFQPVKHRGSTGDTK